MGVQGGRIPPAGRRIDGLEFFELMIGHLRGAGVSIRRAGYDGMHFGSWAIEIGADPPLQIVWDGRERWVVVQRFVSPLRPSFRPFRWLPLELLRCRGAKGRWEDVWMGREEEGIRLEEVLSHVLEVQGKPP